MESNIFDFDDISCHQQNGMAMGTSVACMYVTLYFAEHEEMHLCNPVVNHGILFYVCFIDDVFLIQWQYPGSHARLHSDFNSFGPPGHQLKWESLGPKTKVNFLDLTLTKVDGWVKACTYEKPMNLHLYIPAFSAHSPSMIWGLIFSQLHWFWLQNLNIEDYVRFARAFFDHLCARGYDCEQLLTEFLSVALKLDEPTLTTNQKTSNNANNKDTVFLHLQYNPFQISRKAIQSTFRQTCSTVLEDMRNPLEYYDKLGIKRLIIALSRAPNLWDRLCCTCLVLPAGHHASDIVNHLQGEI